MRNPPQWLRIFFAVFPFVSLFFFPWPITLVTAFAAGLVFPPLALLVGILVDVLYHPEIGWLIGTITGLGLSIFAHFVRSFVQNRIM